MLFRSKICSNCKTEVTYDEDMLQVAQVPEEKYMEMTFYKGEGCELCDGTGYRGRQGLYEVMPVTPAIRRMIVQGESADQIKNQAIADDMLTLRDDGLVKVARGVTTLDEVLKETAA